MASASALQMISAGFEQHHTKQEKARQAIVNAQTVSPLEVMAQVQQQAAAPTIGAPMNMTGGNQ